ncbi:unnamed protein product [Calypogeia fissa]
MATLTFLPHRHLPKLSTLFPCGSPTSWSSCSSSRSFSKGQLTRLPALSNFTLGCSQTEVNGAEPWSTERGADFRRPRGPRRLNASSERFSSPKTGSVGADRFKDGAVPGTYWNDSLDFGEEVSVTFNTGSKNVTVNCRTGDNLLKVAESGGVMIPTRDFCFEGSCYHCEMEVEGGAMEVGFSADPRGSDLIRSCLCPVPRGRQAVVVNVVSDDDVWGAGVV